MLTILLLLAQEDPLPFQTKTRDYASFGVRSQVPEYWKLEETDYYKAGDLPVVLETLLGTPKDAKETLRIWLEKKMPQAYDSGFKPIAAEVQRHERFQLKGGATLDAVTVSVKERHGTTLRQGFLVAKDGLAVFAGSEWSWVQQDQKRDVADWEKVLTEMISVVSNAQFEIPPARDEWTAWLAARGSYSSWSSGNTSASTMQIVSDRKRIWKFGKDGTFATEADDYLGLTGLTTTGPTWHWVDPTIGTWQFDQLPGSLTKEGKRKAAGTFEVRGRDDRELWILAYHKDGPITFHRLEPAFTRVYFDEAYQVLAIDGRAEGRHEYGSGYSIYTPPPDALQWDRPRPDKRVTMIWRRLPGAKDFAPFRLDLVDPAPKVEGPCRIRENGKTYFAYLAIFVNDRDAHVLQAMSESEEALKAIPEIVKSVKQRKPPSQIEFTAPKGWTQAESRWTWSEKGAVVGFFSWSESRPTTGEDLAKQLGAFRKWQADWEVLKELDAYAFTNSKGLKGVGQVRALKREEVAIAVFEALFLVDDTVHHFLFVTESYEVFQKRLKDDILPMLEAAKKK